MNKDKLDQEIEHKNMIEEREQLMNHKEREHKLNRERTSDIFFMSLAVGGIVVLIVMSILERFS